MPERGTNKKIKTLGELRDFINNTLGDLEDDYELDVDGGLQYDITLIANCDISYADRSLSMDCEVDETFFFSSGRL